MKCTVWMKCEKQGKQTVILIIRNIKNIEIHANYAGSSRQIKKKEKRNRVGMKSHFLFLCVSIIIWPIEKIRMDKLSKRKPMYGNKRKHLNVGKSQDEKKI